MTDMLDGGTIQSDKILKEDPISQDGNQMA